MHAAYVAALDKVIRECDDHDACTRQIKKQNSLSASSPLFTREEDQKDQLAKITLILLAFLQIFELRNNAEKLKIPQKKLQF